MPISFFLITIESFRWTKFGMQCILIISRISRSVELDTRPSREQFNTPSNLVLAAALHTAGDIRAGASLQSGDRNGPLYDRVDGLRRVHLLHDTGKNFARRAESCDFLRDISNF